MGLAVSQVRLLALTNRKADIELQMQINSKRKQQLTRKATELSQEYYNRLQNTAIMYATSNGYEDVDFNYVMGVTDDGEYTGDFLNDLVTGWSNNTVHKPENKMILTDSFGQVVVNNTIAKVVAKINDQEIFKKAAAQSLGEEYVESSIQNKTVDAIVQLIKDNVNSNNDGAYSTAFASIYNRLFTETGSKTDDYDTYIRAFSSMIDNYDEVSIDGGKVYCDNGNQNSGPYYSDIEGVNPVNLKDGYIYSVWAKGTSAPLAANQLAFDNKVSNVVDGGVANQLRNIVSYFAPILSAAFRNGISANTSITNNSSIVKRTTVDGTQPISLSCGEGTTISDCINDYINNTSGLDKQGTYYFSIKDSNGDLHYVKSYIRFGSRQNEEPTDVSQFFANYSISDGANTVYENAAKIDKLQPGLKSGIYQFCIVGNTKKGTYHKNTRLNYFTHKGYVSEKTSTSKREEITAWFNVEQAAISEKETYWDTEIQNLSTELTSVTTEIESVKQLKSNAIKSVFNWGGQ